MNSRRPEKSGVKASCHQQCCCNVACRSVRDDALGGLGVDWPDVQQQHSCPDSPDNLS